MRILSLAQSEFVKSVSVLMSGTLVAQALSYLLYPLITRLYTPVEMGELGVFMRIISFISIVATLRYELTIPITKHEKHAFLLYRLSIRLGFWISIATFFSGLFYCFFTGFTGYKFLFITLVAVASFLLVCVSCGTMWAVRLKLYKQISYQRISSALSINGFRLIFGFLKFGTLGLLFATCMGYLISIFYFLRTYFRKKHEIKVHNPKKQTYLLAKEHKDFPTINLPHSAIEVGLELVLAFVILQQFGKESFGLYSFAYLMLRLPLTVIGQSVGQVFFNKCSNKVNEKQKIVPFIKKTIFSLLVIGIVPFAVLYFSGPALFGFVFGVKWIGAGEMSSILALALLMNFVLSPISTIALILKRQKTMFFIGVLVVSMQLMIFGLLPQVLTQDFKTILWIDSIAMFLIYIVASVLYFRFAIRYEQENCGRIE